MISRAISFRDLDPVAWRNLGRLFLPPPRPGQKRRPRTPPLVLFIEGGVCVKALRPGGAPVAADFPTDYPWAGPWSLGRLRRAAGAPWALAIEDDALDRLFEEVERVVNPASDYVAQVLAALGAARGRLGRGLHFDPDPLTRIPVPAPATLQSTMDALLPDGRSAALFVFDGAAVWTSAIIEKQGGDVVRVTTHAALGVARPDFRQGRHRELLAAIESRVARPHLGLFLTLDAWREVVEGPPGALAQKVATREAVIDPAPPWLVAMTGLGAVAGVAQGASRLFGRFVPQAVKDTARAMSATPLAALGFDPIQLLDELRSLWMGKEGR